MQRNGRGILSTYLMDIQSIIEEYCELLYTHKLDNSDEPIPREIKTPKIKT